MCGFVTKISFSGQQWWCRITKFLPIYEIMCIYISMSFIMILEGFHRHCYISWTSHYMVKFLHSEKIRKSSMFLNSGNASDRPVALSTPDLKAPKHLILFDHLQSKSSKNSASPASIFQFTVVLHYPRGYPYQDSQWMSETPDNTEPYVSMFFPRLYSMCFPVHIYLW